MLTEVFEAAGLNAKLLEDIRAQQKPKMPTNAPGVLLRDCKYASMTTKQKQRLAEDVVRYVRGLSKGVSKAKLAAARVTEMKAEFISEVLEDDVIRGALGKKEWLMRKKMAEHIQGIRQKKTIIVHDALDPAIIKVDPKTMRFTGVSDNAGIRPGTADEAFMPLYRYYPEEFAVMLCNAYSRTSAENLTIKDLILCETADYLGRGAASVWAGASKILAIQSVTDALSCCYAQDSLLENGQGAARKGKTKAGAPSLKPA